MINQKRMNELRREHFRRSRRSVKGHIAVLLLLIILAAVGTCSGQTVAATLYHECRGETEEGQRAVASVIWNRAQTRKQTVGAVCLAPWQFSCHNGGFRPANPLTLREGRILARFESWELQMLEGRFVPAGDWDHYYNHTEVTPHWAGRLVNKKIIGNHTFGLYK